MHTSLSWLKRMCTAVGLSVGSRLPCAGDTLNTVDGSGWEGSVRSSVNLFHEGSTGLDDMR